MSISFVLKKYEFKKFIEKFSMICVRSISKKIGRRFFEVFETVILL